MGTTSVSPTTSNTSTTPLVQFNGISTYAAQFQSIVQKAVDTAEIPVQTLQTQESNNLAKKQALITLNPAVAAVANDVAALGTLASGGGLSAGSTSSAVSVQNVSATAPGSYTLSNITVATAASETTLAKYADATTAPPWIAGQTSYKLVVGSNTYNLNLTSATNNLTGLENAINTSGAPVAASMIDTGSGDYLTLTATNVGATTLSLSAVPQQGSLLTKGGTGIEQSLSGYASATTTPVSINGTVDLTVGNGSAIQLNVSGANNNLTGLMNAINNAGAGVTASITSSGGRSYLKVTDPSGPTSISLNDMPPVNTNALITNTGSGTETSLNGYADTTTTAVSTTGTVDLSVGGASPVQLNVSGANNNLTGLMNAINNTKAGVTASITTNNGQNYLQITDPSGPTSITLNDVLAPTPVGLISDSNQGTDASFTLNNTIQITSQKTNTFNNVIQGVSFDLNQNTSGPVTISLTASPTDLSNALQSFVNDYNTLVSQVDQQEGQGAGALGGDSVISEISGDLRQLTSYWIAPGSSTVHSLYDLGVTFSDTTGQLSFDSSVVGNFTSTQMADAYKFLGSSTSGFAQMASNFTTISNPIEGMIQDEENGLDTEDTTLQGQISTKQDQISNMQSNMTLQLEQADALVSQLQSQQNILTAEIESIDYVNYGKPLSAA